MEHYILHSLKTSASFKEKSSGQFKGLHKLTFQTDFDVNLTTSLGGETNTVFNF